MYEVADVALLPWPHQPSRCHFWPHWKDAVTDIIEERDPRRCPQPFLERAARALTPAELRSCPYHLADWRRAAEAAIECWTALGATDASSIVSWLAATHDLEAETLQAAASFFSEPIWLDGPARLGAGQHRVCAMKLAGVSRCLIEP